MRSPGRPWPSESFQVDARFARRLTAEGPDALVGIGAAWRFGGGR